jgi:hypothetical protein
MDTGSNDQVPEAIQGRGGGGSMLKKGNLFYFGKYSLYKNYIEWAVMLVHNSLDSLMK